MEPTDLAQIAALLITLSIAFGRGSKWEIIGGVLILTAALLTPIAVSRTLVKIDLGLLAVDFLLFLTLCCLACVSKRRWVLAATIFQAAAIFTHLFRGHLPLVQPSDYDGMVAFWAYPVILSLLYGTLFEAHRDLHWPNMMSIKSVNNIQSTTGSSLTEVGNDLSMNDDLHVLGRVFDLHDVHAGNALARKLIAQTGGLGGAISASPQRLRSLGANHEAITALALIRRAVKLTLRVDLDLRMNIDNPSIARDYLFAEMARLPVEQFRVIYINANHRVVHDEVHSIGTVHKAEVYIRDIIARALDTGAMGIILAHNHPSGNPKISPEDVDLTREIIEVCKQFEIKVVDHIVVGSMGHTSFRVEGLLGH